MHTENKSEVARLLRSIEEEYLAGQRALYGLAVTASHEFIAKRQESIGCHFESLVNVVGSEQEAVVMVIEALANAADENGLSKPFMA